MMCIKVIKISSTFTSCCICSPQVAKVSFLSINNIVCAIIFTNTSELEIYQQHQIQYC